MNTPLRIGFIGAGAIVKTRHLPGLRKLDMVFLMGACNSTPESTNKTLIECGMIKPYPDWRKLATDPDLDIVWIGTWPYLHCEAVLAALEAGKHVFCQARMAMNVQEARRMLDAAKASDRVTMLCPPPFGLKGDAAMKKLLHEEKALGDIYSIHLRCMSNDFIDPNAPLHWRQRAELSGVNTLMVGIFAEVTHRWFGFAKTVSAQAKTFIPERQYNGTLAPVTRPDVVLATSEMECGALMRWEWSGLAQPAPGPSIEAYGAKGAIRYDFATDEISLSQNGEPWRPYAIPDDLVREWQVEKDFIDAVRTGKVVRPNFEDGLKYMQFTEALDTAAKTGGAVLVSDI